MIQIRDKFFANFFLKKVITNEHVLFALANESGKSLLNKIMSNTRIILIDKIKSSALYFIKRLMKFCFITTSFKTIRSKLKGF